MARTKGGLPVLPPGGTLGVGRNKQLILKDKAGKEVAVWKNSSDLLRDIFIALKMFRDGEISEKAARIYLGLLRSGAVVLALNLDFARLTGSVKQGQNKLSGFEIA